MSVGIIRNLGSASERFVPFEQEFDYTGGIQILTVPYTGLYKLEVWGAQGGGSYYKQAGAKGGYSMGHTLLHKNEILYIVVGGKGGENAFTSEVHTDSIGGYNGGANSYGGGNNYSGGGGGATHIAKMTGTLEEIGYTNFVTNNLGLIVAGGGAGSASNSGGGYTSNAGNGGGLNGGSGTSLDGATTTEGGSQTTGYAFGKGSRPTGSGGGAGGGLFGGTTKYINSFVSLSGGGSGYIDGVPNITYKGVLYACGTSNGVREGAGYAKITRMA